MKNNTRVPIGYKYVLITVRITSKSLLVQLLHRKQNFHHEKLFVNALKMLLI